MASSGDVLRTKSHSGLSKQKPTTKTREILLTPPVTEHTFTSSTSWHDPIAFRRVLDVVAYSRTTGTGGKGVIAVKHDGGRVDQRFDRTFDQAPCTTRQL